MKWTIIGEEPAEGANPKVFCLLLDELKTLDPRSYFVTSGEAVRKAEKLEKDVWALVSQCKKLVYRLKKARGESEYLEVTHEDGHIICRRKDRRPTKKTAKKPIQKPKR